MDFLDGLTDLEMPKEIEMDGRKYMAIASIPMGYLAVDWDKGMITGPVIFIPDKKKLERLLERQDSALKTWAPFIKAFSEKGSA